MPINAIISLLVTGCINFILLQRHFMNTFSIHIKLVRPGGYVYFEYFDFDVRVYENCNSMNLQEIAVGCMTRDTKTYIMTNSGKSIRRVNLWHSLNLNLSAPSVSQLHRPYSKYSYFIRWYLMVLCIIMLFKNKIHTNL